MCSRLQANCKKILTEKPCLDASWNKRHAPKILPRFRGHHGPALYYSYVPPQDLPHYLPNLSVLSRESDSGNGYLSGSSTPHRPSRSPLPDALHQDIDPVSVPRSPTRVKFAPAPQARPSHPGSPSQLPFQRVHSNRNSCDHNLVSGRASMGDSTAAFDSRDSESFHSQESESTYSQESALPFLEDRKFYAAALSCQGEATSKFERDLSPPVAFHINTTDLDSPSLRKNSSLTHPITDFSELRNQRTLEHATVSSPRLPYTKGGTSRSESTRQGMESISPLTSFPSPPLVVHKRPKPLVSLPTHTIARPSTSPAVSSTDSTLLATPTSPYSSTPRKPLSTLHPSKETTRRLFHTVSRPATSPPSRPLPTPPISLGYGAPAARLSALAGHPRPLRSAQSTTELRDFRVERPKSSSAHRTVPSAPASSIRPSTSCGRGHGNPRPEIFTTATYLVCFLKHTFTQLLMFA